MTVHQLVIAESIGPYSLGMEAADALGTREDWASEERGSITVHRANGWLLFIEDGVVTQVGVEPPVEVRGPHGLRLGAKLNEISAQLVFDLDDSVIGLDHQPGLTIDVDAQGAADQEGILSIDAIRGDMRINWLGVHIQDWWPEYVPLSL